MIVYTGHWTFLADDHQFVSIFVGQRAQEDSVHNAEDSGVGANAKRQRQDDCQREAGSVAERADSITDVTHRDIDPACDLDVACPLPLDGRIAEPESSLAACLGRASAFALEIVGAFGKMKRELALDVAFDPSGPDGIEQATQPGHVRVLYT
jgi:hypothetical protein